MSRLPVTEMQWIKYVERNCSRGNLETVIPEVALTLLDAIHLASRLDVTLGFCNGDYIFQSPEEGIARDHLHVRKTSEIIP